MKQKLQNFWYYYKIHTIIILAVLAAALYFFLSQRGSVSSDYNIAVISPQGCSEEHLAKIANVIRNAGKDQNGDGSVEVKVSVYRFSMGKDEQDQIEIMKLDADLVGKESGIFFTEDPDQFEASTNGIGKAADAVAVSGIPLLADCGLDDLYLLPRTDADPKYGLLISALTE